MNKQEIRYKLKIKRRYFQGVRRGFSDEVIAENFFAAYGRFDSFLLYSAKGDEAGTSLIEEKLLASNKKIFYPRVEGENIIAVPRGEMKKGAFGISEPVGQAYFDKIDVTVVPLLAVNERGFRVGYGKGFYDRYLKNVQTKAVGLGYSFQLDEFEEDGWDMPLDEFICEKGIFKFGNTTY